MKKPLIGVLGIAAAAALLLSACSGTGQEPTTDTQGGGDTKSSDLSYAVVTHAAPGDAFWDRVKSGAEKAGADYGADVTYNSDPDPAKQSQLIDNAIAQGVDGIVVSMANPDGVKASVERAVEAGIPVVTINSGIEKFAEFGAITHIGQSESIAGAAVGERLGEEGATNALCVIQEAGNIGLEERCAAAAGAFSGSMANLQVDGTNDAEVKATIKSKLQADPSIDAVLTLGGQYAIDAVGAVEESGSAAKVATFDLSEDVVAAVADGKISFAVDQQPYVQGFLGVTALYLKSTNGNDIGGGQPVYSGPAFVTKDNAAQVAEFAKKGTR
ncbi:MULTISPECIES: sugar ABC transporter substrate-binding protein [unclassified Microbacterium]|uniref:sugar ABC transporter substrate-binding protein n=1 Tax=unclassified Microbacterium TaxID=2609290 RepID=UPI000CFC7779|nr:MULTISPECIES: sugar ABC transporter substrate-binding protein [unclassified Microbacterium]PQZ60168.1 sugar ABC transporter substrate-binding protein [Microbacterium sp. MYb43]PQZ75847.1 sugar ABC transporter substrate-binding protein [Microbacterium sp. MYb40]PRB23210.1 sugar ABC transporter substrate-binding protein [Microbacterium sp. MYb54]PRB28115.1 sugar ABC transporter substrate-binding protein [Microbacterium sp. MYb50]PRB66166.1 sugar ABC transporter substrate-binding protein [Micr